jgi:ABC-type phosphate/phosphonate transport system substrate-binding protein
MKKLLVAFALSSLALAGCSNHSEKHDHGSGTHTHEDGTVHEDHGDSTKQEEFKVGADSLSNNPN